MPERGSESLQHIVVCVIALGEIDRGVSSDDIAHDLLGRVWIYVAKVASYA